MKEQLRIIFLLSAILNFLQNNSFAQAPAFKWATSLGSISDDLSNSIAVDANGNSYVTGTFQSPTIAFGSIGLINSGGPGNDNMFIVKYDLNGTAIWARSIAGKCVGQAIAVDTNGNSYVAGIFFGASITIGGIVITSSTWGWGNSDIFLAKYDQNGNAVWAKSAGGNSYEFPACVDVDANGNSYITGYFDGPTMTFGTTTISNTGGSSNNIFIAKYDLNGNVTWVKSVGGNNLDYGLGISVDSAENIYITGQFVSSSMVLGSTTLVNTGTATDFFIAKFDPNGNALWAKDGGDGGYDYGSDIAVDRYGNSWVVGRSSGPSITFGSITLSGAGFFVAKYDTNGNVMWAKWIELGSYCRAFGVDIDAGNNGYITGAWSGYMHVFGSDTLINVGAISGYTTDDLYVIKYNPAGNLIWAQSAGGEADETSSGIGVDKVGNSYVAGTLESATLYIGSDYLINAHTGYRDFFLAKLGCNSLTTPSILAGGSTSFCSGDSVVLTATTASSYLWNTASTSQSIIAFATGYYTVSINDANECSASSAPVPVLVYPLPDATIIAPTSFCQDGYADLLVDMSSSYLWSTGETNQSIMVSAAGTYSVSVTNSYGCTSSSSHSLAVNPLPVVSVELGVDTLCLYGGLLNLSGGDPAGGMYLGTGISGSTFNSAAAGLGTQVISYSYTDANGCSNSAEDTIKVNICSAINELETETGFTIAPNPFSIKTVISFADFQKNTIIKIVDILGRVIQTIELTGKQIIIDKGEMNKGVYYVRVEYETHKIASEKIIVE